MLRNAIVAVCIAIVAGLVFWLVNGAASDPVEGDAVAAPPSAEAQRDQDHSTDELEAPAVAEDPALESGLDVQQKIAPTTTRELVAASAGPEGGLELAVLDPAGVPVSGAEVQVVEHAGKKERETFYDLDAVDAFMEERGVRRTAGRDGRLRIAHPQRSRTLVVARSGDLWGRADLTADEEGPVELSLALDVNLRARVVDLGGTPLPGARVQLRQTNQGWSWSPRSAASLGDEALASFPHAQITVLERENAAWSIAVEALLPGAHGEPIDPAAWPTEILTLVVPAAGSVEVHVLDEEGAPFIGNGQVSLGIIADGEPKHLSPFSSVRRKSVEKTLENGSALFALVALGHELEVAVRRNGSSVSTRAYGFGPSRVGETRSFDVRIGSDHPVVQFRAIDGAGTALGGIPLIVRTDLRGKYLSSAMQVELTTDPEGYFRLDLENDWTEGTSRNLLIARGSIEDPEASAEVDVGRQLDAGINDLGDVVLSAAPIFVAGRVVTDSGDPVPSAELFLRRRQGEQKWKYWNFDHDFDHDAAADGRFEVRGNYPGGQFQLGAIKDGWACQPMAFQPGDQGLVVVLSKAGAVAGTMLLDDEIPSDLVKVEVSGAAGALDHLRHHERRASPEEDGTFRIDSLLPGEYAVTIRAEGEREPLLEVEGVLVRSDETTRDPRLAEVDLRGELHAHHLTFVMPESGESIQGNVSFGATGADDLEGNRWFHQPELVVVARHASVDLEVSARGFRAVRLEGVSGDAEIELRRGLPVRIVLRGDARLPDPPIFVKAVLADPEDSRGIDWGAPTFDESREIIARAPRTGRLKLQWVVERRSAGSSLATMANVEPAEFFEVFDTEGEQVIEVTVSDEQMQKILAALSR